MTVSAQEFHIGLENVHPTWQRALADQGSKLDALEKVLNQEVRSGHRILPDPSQVLRVFQRPIDEVKVLIVGQDPYPTAGHPVGLSFSVDPALKKLPRSLNNIYAELERDLKIPKSSSGDLTAWEEQGVMLLNRVLTVQEGVPGSHRRRGWEGVTEAAIRALVHRGGALVAVLWGSDAKTLAPLLKGVPMIQSAHPSPLSASRGFIGSRPFSRVNTLLEQQGASSIDWRLSPAQ